ncbi:MAG: hypothetical protein WBL74_05150 [Novosphingobium sp.]
MERPHLLRARSIALLLLVAGLIVWGNLGENDDPLLANPAKSPSSYGDVRLYADIATRVAAGQDYYETATRLQREHHYPLRPFYTVRSPLLAWVNAWFGNLAWPACLLLAIAALAWLHNLDGRSIFERVVALLCLLGIGLPLALSPFHYVHDMWGGLLASIALGLGSTRLAVVPAVLAVLVRELNIPLLGLFTLDRRSRAPALAGLALCIATFAYHRSAVLGWTLPSDPVSQGWFGLRGPAGWVDDIMSNTVLQVLPRPAAALLAFAPVLGWVEVGRHRALTWCLGVFVLVAVLARPDNTYWILNALPVWFVGLAFVPAFLLNRSKWLANGPVAIAVRPKTETTDS